MVSQVTKLPGASTAVPAYWQSKAVAADWQCAMRVLHGDDWKRKLDSRFTARRKKKKAARDRRQYKKRMVKVGNRVYPNWNEYHQKRIKRARSDLRNELRKRPATNKPSNAKPLADWLQKHDFPSRNGKTEKERKLGKFVANQKQAYIGNRKPYLTMKDIRKLEALPGWTFPLPKFGEMLAILEGMNEEPGSLKNVTVQLCPPQSVRTVQLSITTHYDSYHYLYYSLLPIAIYFLSITIYYYVLLATST